MVSPFSLSPVRTFLVLLLFFWKGGGDITILADQMKGDEIRHSQNIGKNIFFDLEVDSHLPLVDRQAKGPLGFWGLGNLQNEEPQVRGSFERRFP